MVIGLDKPDSDDENQKDKGNRNKFPRHLLMTVLMVFFLLITLIFLVINLPGRYKAVVVNPGAHDEVLVLDTVKGNMWRYQANDNVTVITYVGKLKAGEKVPDRIVIKQLE
jgi:hypothetical protein